VKKDCRDNFDFSQGIRGERPVTHDGDLYTKITNQSSYDARRKSHQAILDTLVANSERYLQIFDDDGLMLMMTPMVSSEARYGSVRMQFAANSFLRSGKAHTWHIIDGNGLFILSGNVNSGPMQMDLDSSHVHVGQECRFNDFTISMT
jgi:hypothetical protein